MKNSAIVSRLLFRLLPIQILLASIGAVNGIVSSLFASNAVGVDAMSAVGLYNPINLFIGALSMMLVGGSSILCGKYMGRNRPDKMQGIFALSFMIALWIGAVITAVLLIIGIFDLGGFLTRDSAIRPLLNQYLIGQAIGIIPLIIGNLLAAFLSLENKTRRTTFASITYILVNVLLNYLFVYVLHMEALGLALASSIGLWVFCLIQAQYFLSGSKKSAVRFSGRGLAWKDIGSIMRIGLPGAANTGYQALRGLIVNALITQYLGSHGLSALATVNTLLGIAWAIPTGMLNVSRMMISISVGEEDKESLLASIRNAVYRFIPLMVVISAALIALAVPFTRMYYRDPDAAVYEMTIWGFRILPLCMPLGIFRMVVSCYDQVMDRNILVNSLEAVDGFVAVCLFSWILIPSFGINGVYIANVLNGITSILFLVAYSILKNRKLPVNMEQLIVIPEGFGVEEQERLDFSLKSMDEVISISQNVQEFCLEKAVDPKRSFFAGLFIEEMAGNVVSHGFHKDKKPHSVDIRVVHKDDTVILRIRDDCVPFDPSERMKIIDPEDITKNIGIRIVYKIADDISYQSILGLNVLTIRI